LLIFIIVISPATSDYRQSLQFRHLNEEKQNIQVEVSAAMPRELPFIGYISDLLSLLVRLLEVVKDLELQSLTLLLVM
jgi:hypothetical protein